MQRITTSNNRFPAPFAALTSTITSRFFVQMFLIFRSAEQLHYYSLEGMVEPRVWRGFERHVSEVANLPGVQEWWAVRRSWYSDVFQSYIDETIASGPLVEPQSYLDHACLNS